MFNRCFHKEQDLMGFSEMVNSWLDIPITTANKQVLPKWSHFTGLRKNPAFQEITCNKQLTKTVNTIYKVSF